MKVNDEKEFYRILREGKLLGPKLSGEEVEGVDFIWKSCAAANWPISWVAYALATAYHETAHSMQPIKEFGGTNYFTRMYDIKGNRPSLAKANGNTTPGDGARYFGRGYVQLTWKNNYAKAGKKLGIDLVSNPDDALKADIAAKIMVAGMQDGWFTSISCEDCLPRVGTASVPQFKKARKIINGTDKDDEIAAYAIHFQDALVAGRYS